MSEQHPDGWGVGVWSMSLGWRVQKRVACAKADDDFERVVRHARGNTLVAHIRKRTVGELAIDNTHPFASGKWIFAHNGTIEHHERLRALTSAERLANIRGQTDSEHLFAYLLTAVDRASAGTRSAIDRALARATHALNEGGFGGTTFLLSDGVVIYAHRRDRTLHSLVRTDPTRRATLFASERITDEPWEPVPEGVLHRVTHAPELGLQTITL